MRIHDRRECYITWYSDAGRWSRNDKAKNRDLAIKDDPAIRISWRGYLSHTWAGLLATALLFCSLAGLSIQFVVRAFLIGQTLIRRKVVDVHDSSGDHVHRFALFNVWYLARLRFPKVIFFLPSRLMKGKQSDARLYILRLFQLETIHI